MARVLIILVLALALALPYAGSFLVVDRPVPSDAIVMLAGEGVNSRFDRGLKALKTGLGRELWIDADGQRLVFGKTMAQYAAAYIQTLPPELAAHVHVCPIAARSTFAESADAARCLAALDPHRVLLVTSAYHTRRALSIFKRRVPQDEWSVAAAYDENDFRQDYWNNREWLKTTALEWAKLVFWEVVERWKSVSQPGARGLQHAP